MMNRSVRLRSVPRGHGEPPVVAPAAWLLETARLAPLLACGVAVVLLASVTSTVLDAALPNVPLGGTLAGVLSVDRETNVPTLFSVVLALVCGALAALVAVRSASATGWSRGPGGPSRR